ncbi:uncharacterized protein LOC144639979 [Oculina patagonica]
MRFLFLLLYGVAIVSCDTRSSHSFGEEDSNFKSQRPIRVKRTLLKDLIKRHLEKPEKLQNKSENAVGPSMIDDANNVTKADAASHDGFTVGNLHISAAGGLWGLLYDLV